MPHEQPEDMSLWSGGHDISGPITIGFEAALVIINLFPICVVCLIKQNRNRIPTDELIVSLSITDILSVIIPGPLGWISYFTHQWYGGRHSCQFYQVCVMWFQLTSMCLITFMTFDRWMSLKDALTYKLIPSGNNCRLRISVLLIYCFTLTISCIPIIGMSFDDSNTATRLCRSWLLAQPDNIQEYIFHFIYLTVGYFNLLTTVIVNVLVMMTLWKFQRKFGPKQAERMSSAALQIDRRSVVEFTVMILTVTLVFYLAWLPSLTFLTMIQFHLPIPDEVVIYSLLSTTLTGLLNPVIYGVFSRTYRRGYIKILVNISRFLFGCPLQNIDATKKQSSENLHNNVDSSVLSRSGGDVNTVMEEYVEAKDILLGTAAFDASDLYSQCKVSINHENENSFVNTNYDCERSYAECLLDKDDVDVSKELYSSRLSLLSDESDDDIQRLPVPPRNAKRTLYIQESMI